jgi:hypothetical protein
LIGQGIARASPRSGAVEAERTARAIGELFKVVVTSELRAKRKAAAMALWEHNKQDTDATARDLGLTRRALLHLIDVDR